MTRRQSKRQIDGISATTVGTGGHRSTQLLGWGPTTYWSGQLLDRSFKKARNFTSSSHGNAGFSIWVFKNFQGVIPHTLTAGGGDPLPHQTPSRPLSQTLVPLNFSAVIAPLIDGDTDIHRADINRLRKIRHAYI